MSSSFKELPLFFWRFAGQPMRSAPTLRKPKTWIGSFKYGIEQFSSKFLLAAEISKRFPENYFQDVLPDGVGYALGRFSQDLAIASREGSISATSMQSYMSKSLYKQISSEWESLQESQQIYPLLKFSVKDAILKQLILRSGPPLSDIRPTFMYWDEDLCAEFYKLDDRHIMMKKPMLEFIVSKQRFEEDPIEEIVRSHQHGRTLKARVEVTADVVGGLFDIENNQRPPLRNLNREFMIELEAFRPIKSDSYGPWKLSDIDYLIESRFE